jgi:hypothetical protein
MTYLNQSLFVGQSVVPKADLPSVRFGNRRFRRLHLDPRVELGHERDVLCDRSKSIHDGM